MAKIKAKLKPFKDCNNKAQSYCFKKGFIIYPELIGANYKVRYSLGGNIQYYMKGKEFNRQEAFQSVWDLYTKIYEYDKQKNK
tara:strand:+ start:98 stop:346 length:249 start_codon:yes stop_codon:yes gene_type:complete